MISAIKNHFIRLYHHWGELLREKNFRISLLAGLAILLLSYLLNHFASLYTSEVQTLAVGDLILDHLPTINLSYIYLFGIMLVEAIFYLYPFLFRPELTPFTAKTVAAFFLIRSGFIILTHLGAPQGFFDLPQLADQYGMMRYFYVNDLFFSAHTGFPFLGALLFWENKRLRIFMIFMSILQAVTVLLMHVHYSIDVFSAYFITYTIFVVSDRVFNKLNFSFKMIVKNIEERLKLGRI